MDRRKFDSLNDSTNMDLARRCLALIADIASRGACSQNPDDVGYALQELTQVMIERTGIEERIFMPIRPDEMRDLQYLKEELAFIDSCSQSMAALRRS